MFKDKNIKNVFGQSDDGFRNRFNNTLSTLQAMEDAMPSPKKRARRAAKQPDSHFGWVQFTGTLVATCMIAALLWGVATYWNNNPAPTPEENSIGAAVGSGEEQEPVETLDPTPIVQPIPDSAEWPDYIASNGLPLFDPYKAGIYTREGTFIEDTLENGFTTCPRPRDYAYLDDEYTSLQTAEEIVALAYEKVYDFMRERFYPELYSADMAKAIAQRVKDKSVWGSLSISELGLFEDTSLRSLDLDELEEMRTVARWALDYAFYSGRTIGDRAFRPFSLPETEIPRYDGTNGDLPVLLCKLEDIPEMDRNGRYCFNLYYTEGDYPNDPNAEIVTKYLQPDRVLGYSDVYIGDPDSPSHDHNFYVFYMEGVPEENAEEYRVLSVDMGDQSYLPEQRSHLLLALDTEGGSVFFSGAGSSEKWEP